jgi:hypothetical protein
MVLALANELRTAAWRLVHKKPDHARLMDAFRQVSDVMRALHPVPSDIQGYGWKAYSPEQSLRLDAWRAAFPSWAAHHDRLQGAAEGVAAPEAQP